MTNKVYKCNCGDYHYLEVFNDENEYIFTFIEQPGNLWQYLKKVFARKSYISEIFLSKGQIKQLIKQLEEQDEK